MGEDARYIVEIGTDLLDLAPVLMDSLSQELEEMKRATAEADFSLVREKAHSSRGAALTFGFDIYASELVKVTEAAKKEMLTFCKVCVIISRVCLIASVLRPSDSFNIKCL